MDYKRQCQTAKATYPHCSASGYLYNTEVERRRRMKALVETRVRWGDRKRALIAPNTGYKMCTSSSCPICLGSIPTGSLSRQVAPISWPRPTPAWAVSSVDLLSHQMCTLHACPSKSVGDLKPASVLSRRTPATPSRNDTKKSAMAAPTERVERWHVSRPVAHFTKPFQMHLSTHKLW